MVKISIIALLMGGALGPLSPVYGVEQCHGIADNADLKKIKSISDVGKPFDLFDFFTLGKRRDSHRGTAKEKIERGYWYQIGHCVDGELKTWDFTKDIDVRHKIEGEFVNFLEKIKETTRCIVSIVEGIDNDSADSQMTELALEFKKYSNERNSDTFETWAIEYTYSKNIIDHPSLNDSKLYVEQLFEKKREAFKKEAEVRMDRYKKKHDMLNKFLSPFKKYFNEQVMNDDVVNKKMAEEFEKFNALVEKDEKNEDRRFNSCEVSKCFEEAMKEYQMEYIFDRDDKGLYPLFLIVL